MFASRRVLLAVAFTALGFLALWKGPAKWFGDDLHWTRILAVVAVLFVGFLIAARPGAPVGSRVWAMIGTVGVAVAAWLYVPSPAGRSLDQAIQESSAVTLGLVDAKTNDPATVRSLKDRADALAADYPSLGTRAQQVADVWVRGAAGWYRERFERLPPGNVSTAKALQARIREFDEAFPGAAGDLLTRIDERVKRAEAFDAAFKVARAKADRLLAAKRGEEAFGIARTFAVEMFDEAQFLKRDAELIAFRNDYEKRAEQLGPFVEPAELAPSPRTRDEAPPPREQPPVKGKAAGFSPAADDEPG
jgi:hypothetical protein